MILNDLSGEEITRHLVSLEKGKFIKKTNHGRDRSKTIKKYREAMIHLFEDEQSATFFIDKVMATHKRYARDQFLVLEKAVKYFPKIRETTLEKCIEEKLWSANDFRDVAAYLASQNQSTIRQATLEGYMFSLNPATSPITVSTRSINEYTKFLGGETR